MELDPHQKPVATMEAQRERALSIEAESKSAPKRQINYVMRLTMILLSLSSLYKVCNNCFELHDGKLDLVCPQGIVLYSKLYLILVFKKKNFSILFSRYDVSLDFKRN